MQGHEWDEAGGVEHDGGDLIPENGYTNGKRILTSLLLDLVLGLDPFYGIGPRTGSFLWNRS